MPELSSYLKLELSPLLAHDARPQNVEDDWISRFFDRCRMVSDDDMQSIWANILAGESNAPGSFARKTVDLVATLDKSDAQIFTAVCSYAWKIEELMLVIHDFKDEPLLNSDMNFSSLNHLESLGLISLDGFLGFQQTALGTEFVIGYYDKSIMIKLASDKTGLSVGKVIFTRAGRQLASICRSLPTDDCYLHGLRQWYNLGHTLISPLT